MFSNFTSQDILGTSIAFSLFPLVIVFPGYVAGWSFNLFEFRARLLPARFIISLLLSIAISPILYYLLTSWFSLNAAVIVTILIALIFISLLVRERPVLFKDWPWKIILLIFLSWLILSIFSLIDLQLGNRELYFNVASYDQTTRVSIIDAMTRTGVPPINPSYYPGHYVKLTFLYFFWYILGSIIDYIGGPFVDARAALFASITWCGLALMSMIAFYLRLRKGRNQGKIWQYALIGVVSLLITGLDILPNLVFMRLGSGVIGDIEHWNEQITAWIGSLLWVPHHVAGLIAGFVGVMLVHSARGQTRSKQFITLAFSGIAFASALGLSVWVTFVFVLFWGSWMLFLYLYKEHRPLLLPMAIAGIVALLLAGQFLLGLLSGNGNGGGTFPIALAVRSFSFADVYLENSTIVWKSLVRFIFLPLNYFFELGFFTLVGFVWIKSHKNGLSKNPYYLAEALLLAASFLIGTFVRSTVIENNDLGWRAWLPGQFILLIWGTDVLGELFGISNKKQLLSPTTKYNLIVLATLGIATTVMDITLLRFGYYFRFGPEIGRQIYSARQAYTTIDRTLPQDIIVQYNPTGSINRPSGLYGMRQSAISDRTAYGVPLYEYYSKVNFISEIFNQSNLQNWDTIDSLCKKYFIDVIVVTDGDTLWKSLELLKNQRNAIYMDEYNAVFACGNFSTLYHAP
jgi:hypothetical protein